MNKFVLTLLASLMISEGSMLYARGGGHGRGVTFATQSTHVHYVSTSKSHEIASRFVPRPPCPAQRPPQTTPNDVPRARPDSRPGRSGRAYNFLQGCPAAGSSRATDVRRT